MLVHADHKALQKIIAICVCGHILLRGTYPRICDKYLLAEHYHVYTLFYSGENHCIEDGVDCPMRPT